MCGLPKVLDEQTHARVSVSIIALMLETSRASGQIVCATIEASALMVLSQTEALVLSALTLSQAEQELMHLAPEGAWLILHGFVPPMKYLLTFLLTDGLPI